MIVFGKFDIVSTSSDNVVKSSKEMHALSSAHIKINKGFSSRIAGEREESWSTEKLIWSEAGVKLRAFSDTFVFDPSICIKEGSNVQESSVLTQPEDKSFVHCARRLRPLGEL